MSRFSGRKPRLFIGHLERYVWSLLYCDGKRVVDLGSKDGYGAHLISCFAHMVTLVDRDKAILDTARKSYKFLCGAEFKHADFESEFPKGEWDVAVAFEVIEHVANTEFFIHNIADHLTKGGELVFSVPHMIVNDDHKVLFDEESIKKLISKYFIIEEFYVQDTVGISGAPATSPPKSYIGLARKI